MDTWGADSRRHKRSFAEMSHQLSLSPSPLLFRDPASSSYAAASRFPSVPSNDNILPSLIEPRRTSHPHNQPMQLFHRPAPAEMPNRSQPQQVPRLQHQASQTIIDLTNEPDERSVVSRNRGRSQRPPQLGRSDAVELGDIIDLTDDNVEPDIIITSAPQRLHLPDPAAMRPRAPPPDSQLQRRREQSPLFMPLPPNQRHPHRVFPAVFGLNRSIPIEEFLLGEHNILDHIHMFQNAQPMPGRMDYQNAAFADRKPEHIPPRPARPDFTRSPVEGDVVICPSCEEELVHRKDIEEPVAVKKGCKAPTKKEREEHPFWVVKECGHVYCNVCYQHRVPSGKSSISASFPEVPKPTTGKSKKMLQCAVEDCESEVRGKDKWVGVFL